MEYAVSAVVVVVLLAAYVTWLAGRIERLQARVTAAHTALDAQLVRRAAAAVELADVQRHELPGPAEDVRAAARACLDAADDQEQREALENDLTRAVHRLTLRPDDPAVTDLVATSRRLGVARQVHNDAVRDTLDLRRRRLPRALRLGSRNPMPRYFDIAEFALSPAHAVAQRSVPPAARSGEAAERAAGEATPGPG